MPKIPVYERQVNTTTGTAPTPSFTKPLAPITSNQTLVDGAGDIGKIVNSHLTKMKAQDDEAKAVELDTAFRKDLQNTLYSSEVDDKGKPMGILNRNLSHAEGATVDYDTKFAKLRQDYLSKAKNAEQLQALSKSLDGQYVAHRDNIIRHESQQRDKNYLNGVEANLSQRVTEAALITDPNALLVAMKDATDLQTEAYKKMGMDEKTIQFNTGKTAGVMAKASIENLIETNPELARLSTDAMKGKVPDSVYADLDAKINGKLFTQKQEAVWNQVSNFRLANGYPDEAKMVAFADSIEGVTPEQKNKIVSYVKGQAGSDREYIKAMAETVDTKTRKEILKAKQEGKAYADVIKLGNGDPMAEGFVQRLFDEPDKTNSTRFMELSRAIQEKAASKEDIHNALRAKDISTDDYGKLVSDWHQVNNGRASLEEKKAWEQIAFKADIALGDKAKVDEYMHTMHMKLQGKKPDEILKIAMEDLTKNQPGVGFLGFGTQRKWVTESQKIQEHKKYWEMINTDVGSDVVQSITEGMMTSGAAKAVNPGMIDQFAREFGGYNAIKAGTPVNKAIKILQLKGKQVTPESVKALLNASK